MLKSSITGKKVTRIGAALLFAGGCLITVPITATATSLAFESPGSQIFQQAQNSPCIFGDPSCNNPAGFNFTLFPVQTDGTYASPIYTVGQLVSLVGTTFLVGLDINQSTQNVPPYTITGFTLVINGATAFTLPGTNVATLVNNGNGFSDALITGFDLTGFASGLSAQFFVTYSNDTAGREQYFLVRSGLTPVAEPSTLLLLGSGLVGLGAWGRKRVLRLT